MMQVKKFGNDANNRIMVGFDTTKLDQIEKELGKRFMAQVGVLGVKASGRLAIENMNVGGKSSVAVVKGDSTLTNAEIGLIHEKGSFVRHIPQRSFLGYPLISQMPRIMNKIGAVLLRGLESSNIKTAYAKLGLIAEGVVLKAFSTQGYGTWSDNKQSTINRKGSSKPLIDSGQLRQSIASRVVTL